MRRVLTVVCLALLAVPVAAGVSPEQRGETKWVRGKLTAISGNSITVSSGGKEMTFAVDSDTDVIAPGAGTKTRDAQREGRASVPLNTLLKAGERVEVHYNEVGGKLQALEIRGGITAGEGMGGGTAGQTQTGSSARGTVTAVSDSSITIKSGDNEWTFMVDEKTRVEGQGFGTRTREMRQKGEKPTLSTFIAMSDYVTVRYHDMGGKRHADEVQLVRSAPRR